MQYVRDKSEKRREAPCKCWKEGGGWDEPHRPLPRNDHLRDSALPWGQAPPALGPTSGLRHPLAARAEAAASGHLSLPATPARRPLPRLSTPTHLGTPGGARLGREGTWGGGPKGSGEAPGLEGTGGAAPRADPAGGGPGAGPRDPGRAGGTAGARRCGVGLDVGDLRARGSRGQEAGDERLRPAGSPASAPCRPRPRTQAPPHVVAGT